MFFPEFNPDSRVWVYTADRELSDSEVQSINRALKTFVPEWTAHGSKILGGGLVYKNRFLILAVDESATNASGCSIDMSVRFIKELGAQMNVDFFNRLNLVIEQDGEIKSVHINDLGNYPNWKVYNPMITKLSELNQSWLTPVLDSPLFNS